MSTWWPRVRRLLGRLAGGQAIREAIRAGGGTAILGLFAKAAAETG